MKKAALALVYFLTNIAFAHLPQTTVWDERRAHQIPSPQHVSSWGPEFNKAGFPIKIFGSGNLQQFGSIRKTLNASGPFQGTVLLIQDVHRNAEAQANIGRAIECLIRQNKVTSIGLEGAFGPLNFDVFQQFPDQAAVRAVADYLLSEFKITGPAFALMTTSSAVQAVGIDDKRLYDANVEAYRRSALIVKSTQEKIDTWQRRLSEEKARSLRPSLLALDQQSEAYHRGQMGLGAYAQFLMENSSPLGPQLRRFAEAVRLENSLQPARLESERARLLHYLLPKLTTGESHQLLTQGAAVRMGSVSPIDFYQGLAGLCSRKRLSLDEYPALESYLRYLQLSDRLDAEALLQEVRQTEHAAVAALHPMEKEQALLSESRRALLSQKLIQFSLTHEEWKEHKALGSQFIVSEDFKPFEDFYRKAELRDAAMADALLASPGPRNQGPGTPFIVLVVGGFHSNGVAERLNRAGYDVQLFTPKITKTDTDQGSSYLSVFNQEKTPLEKIFEGDRLFLGGSPASQAARTEGLLLAINRAIKAGTMNLILAVNFIEKHLNWMDVAIKETRKGLLEISGIRRRDGQHGQRFTLEVNGWNLHLVRLSLSSVGIATMIVALYRLSGMTPLINMSLIMGGAVFAGVLAVNLNNQLTIEPDMPEVERQEQVDSVAEQILVQLQKDLLKNMMPPTWVWVDEYFSRKEGDIMRFNYKGRNEIFHLVRFPLTREILLHIPSMKWRLSLVENDPVIGQMSILASLLRGWELERHYSSQSNKTQPIKYWDDWAGDENYGMYQELIHPLMVNVVEQVRNFLGPQPIGILDIFGGDGSFIQRLYQKISKEQPNMSTSYMMVDQSQETGRLADNEIIQARKADLTEPAVLTNLDFKPSIVTSIGGLNVEVIPRELAFQIARYVHGLLPIGGVFILTGITSVLLNKAEFESMGFEVRNTAIPNNWDPGRVPFQLYIAVKKSRGWGPASFVYLILGLPFFKSKFERRFGPRATLIIKIISILSVPLEIILIVWMMKGHSLGWTLSVSVLLVLAHFILDEFSELGGEWGKGLVFRSSLFLFYAIVMPFADSYPWLMLGPALMHLVLDIRWIFWGQHTSSGLFREIRPMNYRDARRMESIDESVKPGDLSYLRWTSRQFAKRLRGSTKGFVVFSSEESMGFVTYHREGKLVHITNMAISPSWQRQGWGTDLLNKVLEAEPDAEAFVAYSDRNQSITDFFFRHHGFKRLPHNREHIFADIRLSEAVGLLQNGNDPNHLREEFADLLELLNKMWYLDDDDKETFDFIGDHPNRDAVLQWNEDQYQAKKRDLIQLMGRKAPAKWMFDQKLTPRETVEFWRLATHLGLRQIIELATRDDHRKDILHFLELLNKMWVLDEQDKEAFDFNGDAMRAAPSSAHQASTSSWAGVEWS